LDFRQRLADLERRAMRLQGLVVLTKVREDQAQGTVADRREPAVLGDARVVPNELLVESGCRLQGLKGLVRTAERPVDPADAERGRSGVGPDRGVVAVLAKEAAIVFLG